MAKFLEVTENGSNRKLAILADKILHVEPLRYNDGTLVTHITYIDKTTVDVIERYEVVKALLSNLGT